MSTLLPHITLHVRRSALDADGHYRMATVRRIEDATGGAPGVAYQKYLADLIMHALTLAAGVEVTPPENNGFTYTLPFRLG